MSLTEIVDRTHAQIVVLYKSVQAQDRVVANCKLALDGVLQRRAVLQERSDKLQSTRPADTDAETDALVDALAADPKATPDIARAAKREIAHQERHSAWRANVTLIDRAMAKLDEEIAGERVEVEAADQTRGALWRAFVRDAHHVINTGLVEAFEGLSLSLIEPLCALELVSDAGGRNAIICVRQESVARDTVIKTTQLTQDRGWKTKNIHPIAMPRGDVVPYLTSFCEGLAALPTSPDSAALSEASNGAK